MERIALLDLLRRQTMRGVERAAVAEGRRGRQGIAGQHIAQVQVAFGKGIQQGLDAGQLLSSVEEYLGRHDAGDGVLL